VKTSDAKYNDMFVYQSYQILFIIAWHMIYSSSQAKQRPVEPGMMMMMMMMIMQFFV
jgi:hypothetical protein